MTLCKLLFDHFVEAGCGGNRSMVAKALEISRRRVNSISDDLDNGAGLASTLTRLLCEYRRCKLDINGIVDLYLTMDDAEKHSDCKGPAELAKARDRWKTEEDAIEAVSAETYTHLKLVSGYISGLCCRDGVCPEEYGEDCPCWWMVGLMGAIQRLDADTVRNE